MEPHPGAINYLVYAQDKNNEWDVVNQFKQKHWLRALKFARKLMDRGQADVRVVEFTVTHITQFAG